MATPRTSPVRRLHVEPLPGYEPEIGRCAWALEEGLGLLARDLADIPAAALDWLPPHGVNGIGTLLYHLAAVELDWLHDVVPGPRPPEMDALLPHPIVAEDGRLTPVVGVSLAEHLDRLHRARSHLLASFRAMTLEEFRRVHAHPEYEVTPEWVLHHLVDHQAVHRGQVVALRTAADRALSAPA